MVRIFAKTPSRPTATAWRAPARGFSCPLLPCHPKEYGSDQEDPPGFTAEPESFSAFDCRCEIASNQNLTEPEIVVHSRARVRAIRCFLGARGHRAAMQSRDGVAQSQPPNTVRASWRVVGAAHGHSQSWDPCLIRRASGTGHCSSQAPAKMFVDGFSRRTAELPRSRRAGSRSSATRVAFSLIRSSISLLVGVLCSRHGTYNGLAA